MKLDVLGLEAFVAIADLGRFGPAAEALHITQTALTRRLQNLEELLDVKLVERTTRSVALTRIGQDFVAQARRLLSDLAAAMTEIRETGKAGRGDVTIACVPTVGVQFLPRVIQEYATRYPQNRIHILDHSSFGVAESVLRREAEFGIGVDLAHHAELSAAPLLQDRFVLACRDDHPLAGRKRLGWRQLASYPLIVAGEASGNRPLLDTAFETGTIALEAHYEVQRSSTALGLVAAGVAAAVVPSLAIQEGAYPRIRVVPLIDPAVSRRLVLLVRKASELSPAAEALYAAIRAQAKVVRGSDR